MKRYDVKENSKIFFFLFTHFDNHTISSHDVSLFNMIC